MYALFLLEMTIFNVDGAKEGSKLFNIDFSLLRKYRELPSTRGSPTTARKFSETQDELTELEEIWLKDVTR